MRALCRPRVALSTLVIAPHPAGVGVPRRGPEAASATRAEERTPKTWGVLRAAVQPFAS
jgi:hypothetical protein